MRALRYHGVRDVRIDLVPKPALRDGGVRIRPAYNGICGSDLHLYYTGPTGMTPSREVPHPLAQETLPITMGHEFSGVVVDVAGDVGDIQVGDRVVVEPLLVCEDCPACLKGAYNLCAQGGFLGVSGGGGGLSESVVVDRRWVHAVGDLPLDEAALIEPLAVAVHAVRHSGAQGEQTAVVAGAGPIGLLVAAVLKAYGLTTIVSELSPFRRRSAESTGVADVVVDPSREDLATVVATHTGGAGADVAFDAAGSGAVVEELLEVLGAGGRLEVVAVHTHPVSLNLSAQLMRQDRSIGASLGYADDHTEALALVRNGRVSLAPFITSRIRAAEIVEHGFEKLIDEETTQIKILVSMD